VSSRARVNTKAESPKLYAKESGAERKVNALVQVGFKRESLSILPVEVHVTREGKDALIFIRSRNSL
jgi:hypothetical protein